MAEVPERVIYGSIGAALAMIWGLYLIEYVDLGCMRELLLLTVTIIFLIFMFRRPPKRSAVAEKSMGENVSQSSGRGGLT